MNPFHQIICAAAGTLGFALFFHIRKERLLPVSLLGAAAWGIYLLLEKAGAHIFFCSFGAALFTAAASEILARIFKAPSLVFCITGIIPMVPGSALYYTIEALANGQLELAGEKAFVLIWTVLGIGAGCAATIAAVDMIRSGRKGQ